MQLDIDHSCDHSGDKKKFFNLFDDILSFPLVKTTEFTEEGTDYFKSKIQIFVFLPSTFVIFLFMFI